MEGPFLWIIIAVLGGSALKGSVKIVNEKNEYLVERLGGVQRKTGTGIKFCCPLH